MAGVRQTTLPDPEAARRAIDEAVPLLGPCIAAHVQAQAQAVLPFLERGKLRWWSKFKAVDLLNIPLICERRLQILSGFLPPGDQALLGNAFLPWEEAIRKTPLHMLTGIRHLLSGERFYPHAVIRDTPARDLAPVFEGLHESLVTLVGTLTTSSLRPGLPTKHPPKFARLREHVTAETVQEELATLISQGLRQYEEALTDPWPGASRGRTWSLRFLSLLDAFLTTDVRARYEAATRGFDHVEGLARAELNGSPKPSDPVYLEIVGEIYPRVYPSYLAIAVNYLKEVQGLMPEYAEASGQAVPEPRVSVTVSGGTFYGSQIAAQIANIDSNIAGAVQQGSPDVADALTALKQAVLSQEGLGDEQRQDLLEGVGCLAEAAQDPPEKRDGRVVKSILSALKVAAISGGELSNAMDAWGAVLHRLLS